MVRLIQFILKLAAERFYGELHVRFRDGKVHGQIEVTAYYIEESIPVPDRADPVYQQLLAEAVATSAPRRQRDHTTATVAACTPR